MSRVDASGSNYVVISADCHAGANVADYKPYLETRYHDDFDAWYAGFENPYDDLRGSDAARNWDSDRRLAEMEADGIVAEVLFPNTIPPFFPKTSLVHQPPGAADGDLERRWAGLRAHNRWLADFCAAAPGRRAGIAQIMLHDVEGSVAEIHWAADHGLTGGVLLPGAPPGSGVPPFYAPDYEPIWRACEERGMPVNHHGGSAVPDMGDYPASQVIFLLEVQWWGHRALGHLIYGGVTERHPDLQFVFTEQGTAWAAEEVARLDYYFGRFAGASGASHSQEAIFGQSLGKLTAKPSEVWARQCHIGASFPRAQEMLSRHAVGTDRIMWGSDYPHREGCWPYSTRHLRLAFPDAPEAELRALVGGNAAALYRFDLDLLTPLAEQFGPSPAEIAVPLSVDEIPDDALRCPAFAIAKMAGAR